MPTIFIDNKPYEVKEGRNLLHACLSLGFDLPYFCWHPAMHSVGACRQCAVKLFKDEKDTRGRIIISCMTAVTEGMRISIDDPDARKFRASIIEWLMVNHPHDCPVCDEGGECHLQDMTVMTGHTYRRFRFRKRTYEDQDLGPFVSHSMNRCIQCYRCVRFYRDYAGGRDLDVYACHDHVYFGRYKNGALESEFAGNLVEICPTGVFTDKTLGQHYVRKWDLQSAPSICVHCGVGCNTLPGARDGSLRRIRNRFNGGVNGYFLCDRGRYGYEFVNSEQRIREPLLVNEEGTETRVDRETAIGAIRGIVTDTKGRVLGVGSARASLESNFALRSLVGPDNFYAGVAPLRLDLMKKVVEILSAGPAPSPSLEDMARADAIFMVGENIPDTAPIMALTLRQAARNGPMKAMEALKIPQWNANAVKVAIGRRKASFFMAASAATRLDDLAQLCHHLTPQDQARLAFAVASMILPDAPKVPDLSIEMEGVAAKIAAELKGAEKPLVLSGVDAGSGPVMEGAASIAWALCRTGRPCMLAFSMPECNSMGLAMMNPKSLHELIEDPGRANGDVMIVLENDLFRHLGPDRAERLLRPCHVIVLDYLPTETTRRARIVLPAAAFPEAKGTLVNTGGLAQRFYQIFVAKGSVRESWAWAREVMKDIGKDPGWSDFDELQAAMAAELPVFSDVLHLAPPADYRIAGMRIARQPHRASGRTALHADMTVHEPKPPEDNDSPFSFSMEGYTSEPPPPLIPRFWAPRWNSVQSVNKFQEEVGGPLRGGDPGKQLIRPSRESSAPFFCKIPEAFSREEGTWLIAARSSVFGSDELSGWSPGITERTAQPCIWISPRDAPSGKGEGQRVALSVGTFRMVLPVRYDASLPPGLAMVPSWLPGLPGETLPLWGSLESFEKED